MTLRGKPTNVKATGRTAPKEPTPELVIDMADQGDMLGMRIPGRYPEPLLICSPRGVVPDGEAIQRMLTKDMVKSDFESGYIYVFESNDHPNHLKVGYTKKTVKERIDGWKTQCKCDPKEVYPRGLGVKIPHAHKVESLIKAELNHYQENQYCRNRNCGHEHREWFNVTPEQMEAVIEKWSSWIQQNPYEIFDYNGPRPLGRLKKTWLINSRRLCKPPNIYGRYDSPTVGLIPLNSTTSSGTLTSPQGAGTEEATTVTVAAGFVIVRGYVTCLGKKILPTYIAIHIISFQFYPLHNCLAARLTFLFVLCLTGLITVGP
ncbi:MAG: hypothetical protein M1813_008942 [Trichoglossum hirsutum]|jgi:hypothetical protein|nr:MAG: hypothetical protein M1813_008942 [Trichoglossum hirsutum]